MERCYDRGEFLALCGLVGLGLASMVSSGCAAPGVEDEGVAGGVADGERNEHAELEGVMGSGVMVGYASRAGSTKGVAEAIAEELRGRGLEVSLVDMAKGQPAAGFESAVLCSAVQGGTWLPEAQTYVEANTAVLTKIPVALVCVHIMNAGDDDRARERRMAYLDGIRPSVSAAQEVFFLGRGPTAEDANWIMRWAFKAFGGAGEGDLRDWDAIRGWARELNLQRG